MGFAPILGLLGVIAWGGPIKTTGFVSMGNRLRYCSLQFLSFFLILFRLALPFCFLSIVFVMNDKSKSLHWPEGSDVLYGKNSFKERIAKAGAVSDWVKSYIPKATTSKKTDDEIHDDLLDRIAKLSQLQLEGILSDDETKIVKEELKELRGLLNAKAE